MQRLLNLTAMLATYGVDMEDEDLKAQALRPFEPKAEHPEPSIGDAAFVTDINGRVFTWVDGRWIRASLNNEGPVPLANTIASWECKDGWVHQWNGSRWLRMFKRIRGTAAPEIPLPPRAYYGPDLRALFAREWKRNVKHGSPNPKLADIMGVRYNVHGCEGCAGTGAISGPPPEECAGCDGYGFFFTNTGPETARAPTSTLEPKPAPVVEARAPAGELPKLDLCVYTLARGVHGNTVMVHGQFSPRYRTVDTMVNSVASWVKGEGLYAFDAFDFKTLAAQVPKAQHGDILAMAAERAQGNDPRRSPDDEDCDGRRHDVATTQAEACATDIVALLSGHEWSADTVAEVAENLRMYGYEVLDLRDDIHESYVADCEEV